MDTHLTARKRHHQSLDDAPNFHSASSHALVQQGRYQGVESSCIWHRLVEHLIRRSVVLATILDHVLRCIPGSVESLKDVFERCRSCRWQLCEQGRRTSECHLEIDFLNLLLHVGCSFHRLLRHLRILKLRCFLQPDGDGDGAERTMMVTTIIKMNGNATESS